MPRVARVKSKFAIYHIMLKGVGGLYLFEKDKEKSKYLELIKKYQIKYGFKLYAYCIMDNHAHLLIYSNGADISKFMHGINQSFAQYFNKTYNRTGHVFADRFKSKIATSEKYLLVLSAYIHKNPKDIKKWGKKYHKYPYSSLGILLQINEDAYDILDKEFLLQQFGKTLGESYKNYLDFLRDIDISKEEIREIIFEKQKSEYRSNKDESIKVYSPDVVIDYVCSYLLVSRSIITVKNSRKCTKARALAILLIRRFCNCNIKDICRILGDITQSRVSKLSSVGVDYIINENINLFNDFERKIENKWL